MVIPKALSFCVLPLEKIQLALERISPAYIRPQSVELFEPFVLTRNLVLFDQGCHLQVWLNVGLSGQATNTSRNYTQYQVH